MPNIALELGKQSASLGVSAAYGEQQDVDGIRIIPVAFTWSGFGGGSDESGNGGGGGGGYSVPLGAYIRKGGDLRFEPNLVSLLAVAIPFVFIAGRALSRVIRALKSSGDPVTAALVAAASEIIGAVAALGVANPVILIDGRSGAGKTSLARVIVARWALRGRVQLVALDSLYPGWDGLADGVETARETILRPHARGLIGVWQRWDWDDNEPAEAHAVDPSLPLIVEGSGLLTTDTARLGDVRVWLEAPTAVRKQRALDRDGDTYRPHWTRWAEQEERHLSRDAPTTLATHTFRTG